MSPHEPPPDDFEPISELILNLDPNDDGEEEEEDLPPYKIVGVDMEGNTVPFPEPLWDLEQLPIPIFGNQDVLLLVPNEENFDLFPLVPMPLQQTVKNVSLQNMDEDEAPLPEFEEIDGNEFLEQMDQETKVAHSEQINDKGDAKGEKGQVFHLPTNLSVIEIHLIDFTCLPFVFSLFAFSFFLSLTFFVASIFSVVLMSSDSARPTASRPWKDPLKRPPKEQPRKAAKTGKWPRECVGRDLMRCLRPVAQSEAHVCPNGDVWHLSCVRSYLLQVRETYCGEACAVMRALNRQRLRELRAYFKMGGSGDVP